MDSFFENGDNEVKEAEEKLGKSNKYSVSDEGLELKNDAKSPEGYNYASNVESKGYEVLSGAALFAEKRLKEEIEW